ncbi:MAG: hypothetical protein JO204_13880 [Alphaproteobacteria bacterium]|nr:hypothetical protein [Alphaproteobacteria bacterium]
MDRKTVEFRSTILGCSVNAVVANDDQSIYLAEALLGAIEAFLATSLEQRILPFRSEAKLVVKASAAAAAPLIISEERAAGYQSLLVQHPLAEPNQVDAYHQKYRDTMMEAVARVLMHISVLDDVEEYFKSVAGEERGFARALIFSDIGVISENVFGAEPRLRLTDLLEGDETVYRLKRDKKWSEGLVFEAPAADENEDQEPSPDGAVPSGLAKFANMPHSARQVVSLIDVPLWNRAGWSATMYASDPLMRSPPILGIGFKDIAAGREIFHELRAKLGNADQNNKLRVAILTGIDRANPPSYNVVIGTNLRSSTVESGKLFMTVSRVNQMTPRDTSNLDRFLMAYRENGTYFIAPVHFDGSRAEMPEVQLGIRKTDIIVRPAWEVGPHDEDAMGIRGDDDPIIPEGQDDAPVLKTLKARQQGFGRR